MHAIGVGVCEHFVADGGQVVEAGVQGRVVFARRQGHDAGQGAVTVDAVVAADVRRAGFGIAGRGDELHLIFDARRQTGKAVFTIAVGCGGIDDRVVLQQVHGRTGNALLARILNAVGIGVVPDIVTQ